MKKREHVPETKETSPRPNRSERRHPGRMGQAEDESLTRDRQSQPSLVEEESQDVLSTRAKSSGHGKKTADKWNQ